MRDEARFAPISTSSSAAASAAAVASAAVSSAAAAASAEPDGSDSAEAAAGASSAMGETMRKGAWARAWGVSSCHARRSEVRTDFNIIIGRGIDGSSITGSGIGGSSGIGRAGRFGLRGSSSRSIICDGRDDAKGCVGARVGVSSCHARRSEVRTDFNIIIGRGIGRRFGLRGSSGIGSRFGLRGNSRSIICDGRDDAIGCVGERAWA